MKWVIGMMATSESERDHETFADWSLEEQTVNTSRKLVVLGLGVLWVFDGVLQLQPSMFTQSFAVDTVGSAIMGLPAPLYHFSLNFLQTLIIPYISLWNWLFALTQIAVGLILIKGSPRARRYALVASIPWSLFIWVFGEGLGGVFDSTMSGGVFPGTPSIISGFPGAALLYAWVAVLALLPQRKWRMSARISAARDGPAVLFAVAALVQASPLMWTTFGQASIFAADLDNLPARLGFTVLTIESYTASHPFLSNSLEVGITALVALTLFVFKFRKWPVALEAAWLLFIWWFGLGLGGTPTGLGTDPNTPPVIILLTVPRIVWSIKLGQSRKRSWSLV
jgi:hypothetical protein